MSSPEDARRLVEYGNRRSVGGNIIKMSYVSDIPFDLIVDLYANLVCVCIDRRK